MPVRHPAASGGRRVRVLVVALAATAGLTGIAGAAWSPSASPAPSAPGPAPAVAVHLAPPVRAAIPKAVAAPAGLPVIDYAGAPHGFPDDPWQSSTVALTAGLHPARKRIVYDAPGGRPRAYLPPTILGAPVTVPIVARRPGWVAVLLPSVNRRIGWLTSAGWSPRPLRDQLVVRLRAHELSWWRDGVRQRRWTVSTGSADTPTPRGRTFVLGRGAGGGSAYANLDVLALGSVPDHRGALPAALRGAHTGIHSWYDPAAFGHSVSNGCVRIPRDAQRLLLANLAVGTPVIVTD